MVGIKRPLAAADANGGHAHQPAAKITKRQSSNPDAISTDGGPKPGETPNGAMTQLSQNQPAPTQSLTTQCPPAQTINVSLPPTGFAPAPLPYDNVPWAHWESMIGNLNEFTVRQLLFQAVLQPNGIRSGVVDRYNQHINAVNAENQRIENE